MKNLLSVAAFGLLASSVSFTAFASDNAEVQHNARTQLTIEPFDDCQNAEVWPFENGFTIALPDTAISDPETGNSLICDMYANLIVPKGYRLVSGDAHVQANAKFVQRNQRHRATYVLDAEIGTETDFADATFTNGGNHSVGVQMYLDSADFSACDREKSYFVYLSFSGDINPKRETIKSRINGESFHVTLPALKRCR